MHEVAPPDASSKALNNGPNSSQLANRWVLGLRCSTVEKSGVRKGFASCRAITDWGTTRRSTCSVGADSGSGSDSSEATDAWPAARCMSRRSSLASKLISAFSSSSTSKEVSRVAVFARIVATPSRRLSWAAFCAALSSVSAFSRERSSRTSSATTWNLVRPLDFTRPRCDIASTSRTARASTGMIPSLSSSRPLRRWPLR